MRKKVKRGGELSFILGKPMEVYKLIEYGTSHVFVVPKSWIEWFCPHHLVDVEIDPDNRRIILTALTKEEAEEFERLGSEKKEGSDGSHCSKSN